MKPTTRPTKSGEYHRAKSMAHGSVAVRANPNRARARVARISVMCIVLELQPLRGATWAMAAAAARALGELRAPLTALRLAPRRLARKPHVARRTHHQAWPVVPEHLAVGVACALLGALALPHFAVKVRTGARGGLIVRRSGGRGGGGRRAGEAGYRGKVARGLSPLSAVFHLTWHQHPHEPNEKHGSRSFLCEGQSLTSQPSGGIGSKSSSVRSKHGLLQVRRRVGRRRVGRRRVVRRRMVSVQCDGRPFEQAFERRST